LFTLGHINNIELFYAFEEIKRINHLYHFKRHYIFGEEQMSKIHREKKKVDETTPESIYMNSYDIERIL
jgi:hypothetical protein